jgi:hypothetical protein
LPFSPGDLQVAPRGAAARKAAPAPEPSRSPEPEFLIDKPLPAEKAAPPPVAVPSAVASPSPVPAPRKASPPARAGKAKGPAGLTVTLAYADGEWTVAAVQGAKSLARPYVVRPAEALRMVALVDVPGVREAVEQILAVERAEAQSRAERLRAELAEVEARLAELPEAP